MARLKPGLIINVPEPYWAMVAKTVENYNRKFEPIDKALLQKGQVEVIGEDPKFGVLVRYVAEDPTSEQYGSDCPHHALLFIQPFLLKHWISPNVMRLKRMIEEAEIESVVEKLLAGF